MASGSVIGGPYRHSWIIDTAEQVRVMGVNFRPGGVHALLGIDAEALGLRDINLEAMFGAGARRLRQRLLETACSMRRLALLEQWLHTLCDEEATFPGWERRVPRRDWRRLQQWGKSMTCTGKTSEAERIPILEPYPRAPRCALRNHFKERVTQTR